MKYCAVILVACLVSCAVIETTPVNAQPRDAARLLVKLRPGVTLDAFDDILGRYGGKRIDVIAQINVHIVEVMPQAAAREVALRLKHHPEIESVEIDERLAPSLRPAPPQAK